MGGGSHYSIFGIRRDNENGEGGKEEGGNGAELMSMRSLYRDRGGDTSLGVDPTNIFGDVALFGDDAGVDEPVTGVVAATEYYGIHFYYYCCV